MKPPNLQELVGALDQLDDVATYLNETIVR